MSPWTLQIRTEPQMKVPCTTHELSGKEEKEWKEKGIRILGLPLQKVTTLWDKSLKLSLGSSP